MFVERVATQVYLLQLIQQHHQNLTSRKPDQIFHVIIYFCALIAYVRALRAPTFVFIDHLNLRTEHNDAFFNVPLKIKNDK